MHFFFVDFGADVVALVKSGVIDSVGTEVQPAAFFTFTEQTGVLNRQGGDTTVEISVPTDANGTFTGTISVIDALGNLSGAVPFTYYVGNAEAAPAAIHSPAISDVVVTGTPLAKGGGGELTLNFRFSDAGADVQKIWRSQISDSHGIPVDTDTPQNFPLLENPSVCSRQSGEVTVKVVVPAATAGTFTGTVVLVDQKLFNSPPVQFVYTVE